MSVFRNFVPRPVIVEVAVTNRVARDVTRGGGIVFFFVATLRPAIEIIRTRRSGNAVANVLRAVEFAAVAGLDRIALAASRNVARTTNHGDASRFAVFGDVDAESARFLHGKSEIRRVDFVDFAFAQFAHAEIN